MRKNIIAASLAALALTGCGALTPAYETPQTTLPSAEANVTVDKTWWKRFNDPTLDGLMDEALANNYDLLLAAGNVAQARAALGLANAQVYPNIGASASAAKVSTSEESFGGSGAEYDNYAVSGVLSYEVDLWGRLFNARKAALSSLLAMEATRDTIGLSLSASVAESYFSLLTLQQNTDAVQTLLIAKKEGFALRKKQYEKGAITELLLRQVEADMSGTQAQLELLRRQRDSAATALSVLVGRTPKEIVKGVSALSVALPQGAIETFDLPSDLISRRPDIRAAEENLKAANYNVGAARAAYFPTLSLTGSAGFQSQEMGNLMSTGAATTQLSAGLNVPLFDFGRIGAQIDAAKAGKENAIVRYRQSVQRAFAETHDALNRRDLAAQRLQSVSAQAAALERALELTRRKYEVGYVDYMAVIDAEGVYLNAKINENSAKLEQLNAGVNLYKALGGGWEVSKPFQ